MGLFEFLNSGKQKRLEMKTSLVSEALSEVFTGCEYNPHGSIQYETIRDTGLVDDSWNFDTDSYDTKLYFKLAGNDYFSGSYKGHEFECCDADVTKYSKVIETDSDGNETERENIETSFKGPWMICKLDKPISGTVRVREKADAPLLFKWITGPRIKAKSDVETENTAFNEQFQILTDNAHSAFMILTPHFMEHILSADTKANGRTMLCFTGDKVHIAIHSRRDSFEIKRRSEMKDQVALKQRIQGEIKYLTDILDELFLNEALFGKEK